MPTLTLQQALDLALQHHQAGRLVEAEGLYRQILAVQPSHAEAWHLLGVIAHQTGRQEEAMHCINESLARNSSNARAHSNLGEVHAALGDYLEAIRSHQHAIQLNPSFWAAHYNLGNALLYAGCPDEAIASYRQAIALQPRFAKASANLGVALFESGDLEGAISAYRQAMELNSKNAGTHSNLIYALTFHPCADHQSIQQEQQRWNKRFAGPCANFPLPSGAVKGDRRIRVGYISPDFRDHVIGRNLRLLFERHDHSAFEIVCFSDTAKPDELTDRFREYADSWVETGSLSDGEFADTVRSKQVDILVDLTQHMAGNRLPAFARGMAPVQVSFAGYPESTGVEAIGYRVSDRWLEGEGAGMADGRWQMASGRMECVFLLDSFWCYDPCGSKVPVSVLPAAQAGGVTFGSLNNFCKVNEPLLRLWARVLGAVEDARFVLLSHRGHHRQKALDILEREGVAPQRVEFVEPRSRQTYLELYHRLDIVLDPFPYNGHTTSLDALWMGVPVVSLVGKSAVSRAGLSQLNNLGLPELVARSEGEYVEIATRLAGDLPRLAELRATLRARMEASVIMDAPHFARQIEEAYRAMWRNWCVESTVQEPDQPRS